MKTSIILGLVLMLLIVSGASGCSKGTEGTASAKCMQGHVQSTCSNGEIKCCLNGWVCCADSGENSCTPESFCEGSIPSDPFVGT